MTATAYMTDEEKRLLQLLYDPPARDPATGSKSHSGGPQLV
jgi:hypothetical protein